MVATGINKEDVSLMWRFQVSFQCFDVVMWYFVETLLKRKRKEFKRILNVAGDVVVECDLLAGV